MDPRVTCSQMELGGEGWGPAPAPLRQRCAQCGRRSTESAAKVVHYQAVRQAWPASRSFAFILPPLASGSRFQISQSVHHPTPRVHVHHPCIAQCLCAYPLLLFFFTSNVRGTPMSEVMA